MGMDANDTDDDVGEPSQDGSQQSGTVDSEGVTSENSRVVTTQFQQTGVKSPQQSGLVDMTVTPDNPITFTSFVGDSEAVSSEENPDVASMIISQFQESVSNALVPANRSPSQQLALHSGGSQASTSLNPVEIKGGVFDGAHIGDKKFNATKNVGVAGGDFRGAHFGPKICYYGKDGPGASSRLANEEVRQAGDINANYGMQREERRVADQAQEVQNANVADLPSSEEKTLELLNDVWISLEDASIVSLFCKDDDSLKRGCQFLETSNHKRIMRLPGEVLATMGNTVHVDCQCDIPRDSMTLMPDINPHLKITKTMLRRRWHQICFAPTPHPDLLEHTKPYEMSYLAELFNDEGEPTDGGFSANLKFCWPRHVPQHSPLMQDKPVPEHDTEYASFITNELGQSCDRKTKKEVIMTPEGNSIEHGSGKIHFRPGAVTKNTDIKVTVDNDPDRFSGRSTTISSSVECQSPELKVPVSIELTSWLSPEAGEELRVQIMSTSHSGQSKRVREVILTDGNKIKYEISHFCWHVAVVSPEDAKKAVCHLYNDVWMDVKFGRILSVFYRDEKALNDGSAALEAHHKRILPLPGEIVASAGSTVKVEFQCISPAGTTITSISGSDARLEIAKEMFKKKFSFLVFRPDPLPELIQPIKPYKVFYHAKVVNSDDQPIVDGGFSSPLHYKWPVLPLKSPNPAGIPTEQELMTSGDFSITIAGIPSALSNVKLKLLLERRAGRGLIENVERQIDGSVMLKFSNDGNIQIFQDANIIDIPFGNELHPLTVLNVARRGSGSAFNTRRPSRNEDKGDDDPWRRMIYVTNIPQHLYSYQAFKYHFER